MHREGEAARIMLARENFRIQNLVDIFDAGPTVAARRDEITTVRDSRRLRARIGEGADGPARLVSHDTVEGFRAVRTPVGVGEEEAVIGAEAAEALQIAEGDMIRIAP